MAIRTINDIRKLLATGQITGGITDPEGDIVQITAEDGSKLDLHLGRSFGDRLPSDDEIIGSIEGIAERGSFDIAPVDRMDAETETAIRIEMTRRILDDGLSPMEGLAMSLYDHGYDLDRSSLSMTRMTGRTVGPDAVTVYLAKARRKLGVPDMRRNQSA